MSKLPPLECLRFFEAAARHESFARAAWELNVTPAAVAYRVKTFEHHLHRRLFDRTRRGVSLNEQGKACFLDVRRVLAQVSNTMDGYRNGPQPSRLNILTVESIAERWLLPKLAGFNAAHPDIAFRIEIEPRTVESAHCNFDLWITFSGDALPSGAETELRETLFEEPLIPVCSPGLLADRGHPGRPRDLHDWPLLYQLGCASVWSRWFAAEDNREPDLLLASGFRLFGSLISAAIEGMGAAIGRPSELARELQQGTLVGLFGNRSRAISRCSLITSAAGSRKPEVQSFREWLLPRAAGQRGNRSSGDG